MILIENIEFIENLVISTMIYNIKKANWLEFQGALFQKLPEITKQFDDLLEKDLTDLLILINLINKSNASNLLNLSKLTNFINCDINKTAEIL